MSIENKTRFYRVFSLGEVAQYSTTCEFRIDFGALHKRKAMKFGRRKWLIWLYGERKRFPQWPGNCARWFCHQFRANILSFSVQSKMCSNERCSSEAPNQMCVRLFESSEFTSFVWQSLALFNHYLVATNWISLFAHAEHSRPFRQRSFRNGFIYFYWIFYGPISRIFRLQYVTRLQTL